MHSVSVERRLVVPAHMMSILDLGGSSADLHSISLHVTDVDTRTVCGVNELQNYHRRKSSPIDPWIITVISTALNEHDLQVGVGEGQSTRNNTSCRATTVDNNLGGRRSRGQVLTYPTTMTSTSSGWTIMNGGKSYVLQEG